MRISSGRGQPRSAEVSRGQPRSADVSRGQPRSAEVSRGQPRSAEVSRRQPRSAEVSRGQPRSILKLLLAKFRRAKRIEEQQHRRATERKSKRIEE